VPEDSKQHRRQEDSITYRGRADVDILLLEDMHHTVLAIYRPADAAKLRMAGHSHQRLLAATSAGRVVASGT
jgi:hypothetical protein